MSLSSPAFEAHRPIPRKYTGEGEDISPALRWKDVPEGTRSFALIVHDPDAPLISPGSYGFVHWVLYNIPGDVREIEEGTDKYTAGHSDFGQNRYGGPMPPNGHGVHHYFFWLIALDQQLNLKPGLTLWELMREIEPHAIGMNRLIGTYERI